LKAVYDKTLATVASYHFSTKHKIIKYEKDICSNAALIFCLFQTISCLLNICVYFQLGKTCRFLREFFWTRTSMDEACDLSVQVAVCATSAYNLASTRFMTSQTRWRDSCGIWKTRCSLNICLRDGCRQQVCFSCVH